LDTVLRDVPRVTNGNVLVGYDTADDAGVYLLTEDCALVQTVDFFTPIVDDPFTYGAIAAANALSDVYAMGGRPISALSILAYPGKGDLDVLKRILSGGADKMREAGCAVIGGHSVNDEEIKFGYAVTGTIHPKRVWTNAGARPGDVLVFTKRIGTGVVATALKRGIAAMEDVDEAVSSMLTLNAHASELLARREVHGCTDITGFGLLGHAREMALASAATFEIDSAAVPLLPGARRYAIQGALPGGLHNNREFVSECVDAGATVPPELMNLLYDPQTSGGLLVSLPVRDAEEFLAEFPAMAVGRVLPRAAKPIRLV
jgi:selenide,water dikinase